MEENLKYLIALSAFSKFSSQKLKKFKLYFKNFKEAFFADADILENLGTNNKIVKEFLDFRKKFDLDSFLEKLESEKIKVIHEESNLYPENLKNIFNAPPLLYYKGNLNLKNKLLLAVVGSRKASHYGLQATEKLTKNLIQNNFGIVSGLALGIDSISHNVCLDNNGYTIAVLGSGIDEKSIYPTSNRELAKKIIESSGAIISEFAPMSSPLKYNFPMRNRIIAGLSLGVLVVEAGEKSGALITANLALEQGKEVFAVPGNIYSPTSQGTHKLIKDGAKLTSKIEDILEELNITEIMENTKSRELIGSNENEKKILMILDHNEKHINDIVRLSELDIATINSTLALMEMKGMVKNLGNMQFIKL